MKRQRAASRKLHAQAREVACAQRARSASEGNGPEETSAAALGVSVLLLASIGAVAVFSATAPLALGQPLPPHFLRHALAALVGGAVVVVAARDPDRRLAPAGAAALGRVRRRCSAPRWRSGSRAAARRAGSRCPASASRSSRSSSRSSPPCSRWRRCSAAATAAWRAWAASGSRSRSASAPLPAALAVLQPDFGNAVILLGLAVVLLFVAGADLRPLLAVRCGRRRLRRASTPRSAPTRCGACSASSTPGRARRPRASSSCSPSSRSGAAASLGVGLGDGRQKLYYLPEAHTDFILSVVAEELGLLGVAARARRLRGAADRRAAHRARARRSRFALLLAFGMTALLTVPALLNAAVVMGLVPTKGLTLPFLSYGRSSLRGVVPRGRDPVLGARAANRVAARGAVRVSGVLRDRPAAARAGTSRRRSRSARRCAARGEAVLFVGTERGIEKRLVPEAGFELVTLAARPVIGRGPVARAAALLALAARHARRAAAAARTRREARDRRSAATPRCPPRWPPRSRAFRSRWSSTDAVPGPREPRAGARGDARVRAAGRGAAAAFGGGRRGSR